MRNHETSTRIVLMPGLGQYLLHNGALVTYRARAATMRTIRKLGRGGRWAPHVIAAVAVNCSIAAAAWSQAQPPTAGTAGSVPSVVPTLSAGGSVLEWDYGGDNAFRGWVVRGGVAIGPLADLTLGVERWPDLHPYQGGWSYQLEASMYPLGRPRVAPYILFGVGHFHASLPVGSIYTHPAVGWTTALALGVEGRVFGPVGIRLEGVARTDAGAGDDQLRVFLTYAPRAGGWVGTSQQGAAAVYGMLRVSGPWHFVEPAYGLEFARGVTDQDALALTLLQMHWQVSIPSSVPSGRLVPYQWDTRAVLLMPAWRRGPQHGTARWYIQAGPALDMMIEGPDFGFRGGVNAEVGGSVRLGPLPGLTAGIGWVWIVRGVSDDPNVPPTDERGVLLHAGIAF